jgi:hypothetical protein
MDFANLDLGTLPHVGGTAAGGYYQLATDVLLAAPKAGYAQTIDGARASLEELHRLAREQGRRQVLLVLVDRVRSQDVESRRLWRSDVEPRYLCGLGLVCTSLLGRAIGSIFIRFQRPTVNTAMLPSLKEGLSWANERLRCGGGVISV